ncbi:CsbD family protein [Liquorilactobacillus satsumensis]|uniref:CsbD-like domain-containing protein n=1 Tax=Liquorilactobacillus satsumensis DSM 16230 = JCM 12392 TaxID=1423801 RepID=A0A0R1V751_9LACO|nr:CsbD family protein [Liquorilactobacillus satsumensis]KRL99427.1 hypothetical protein FD50_GL000123 [Liquorilactobacillus satsumensis DSM 16230 = JCM 12392]MCC7665903.1 CsbD family protein [Liquorilactobacillus satsumensis]MCP9312137.1 CsbD family protein [Liquorilactobacillus satsumensis]MCP9327776.1 CsbD family protein [Liquorilactobacillus satsumensis]MCP9356610.1 CsbD family protein [Liquorilactobacillus satsumensis]
MSSEDKFENAKDKVTGKAKEVGGKVTGDKELESEGKVQSTLGKAKDTFDDAKDAAKGAAKSLKDKLTKKDH